MGRLALQGFLGRLFCSIEPKILLGSPWLVLDRHGAFGVFRVEFDVEYSVVIYNFVPHVKKTTLGAN